MIKSSVLAVAFAVMAQAALALTPEEVIADFQAQGFTRVEVKVGPTQIKVEAIRGTEKVEAIYESATGLLLKTETEAVGAGENTAPGVSVRDRSKDFVRVVRRSAGGAGDDNTRANGDSADDNGGRGGDDDGDDDNGGRGGDDDGDDDNGGRGGDDDGDDDNGGRGGDDDHDDDNGGRGGDDDGHEDDHGGGDDGDDHDDDHGGGDDDGDDHDDDDDN